jgi:branched-chain amino acid transport system permease protein
MMVLISTLAAASFFEQSSMLVWGPHLKRLPELIKVKNITLFGSNLSGVQLLILIVGPLLLAALGVMLKHTRIGLAIRGVEQNREFAQLAGIVPSKINAITYGLGSSMAGIAGILIASKSLMMIQMGNEPQLKAFIVLILGGIGSMGATIGGAFIVGLLESLAVYFVGLYWTPAVLFLAMILVLTFKPTGIFGEK